jgi:hypothetical protein
MQNRQNQEILQNENGVVLELGVKGKSPLPHTNQLSQTRETFISPSTIALLCQLEIMKKVLKHQKGI